MVILNGPPFVASHRVGKTSLAIQIQRGLFEENRRATTMCAPLRKMYAVDGGVVWLDLWDTGLNPPTSPLHWNHDIIGFFFLQMNQSWTGKILCFGPYVL